MRNILYLLAMLSDEDVEWIASAGERRLLPAGTKLVRRRGDPLHALTLILDGAVSVAVAGKGQTTRLVAGDMLGEMPLADEAPPSTQMTAVQSTTVLSLDRVVFDQRISTDSGFAARLEAGVVMLRSVRLSNSARKANLGNLSIPQTKLDAAFMENVHLAGARFDRIVKKTAVTSPAK